MASFGPHLKHWRHLRGLSQLALAVDAGVSQRHLCFVETGRAQPSREMVLRLATRLGVPLRAQNEWLLAAGYAPTFPQRALEAAPMQAVLAAARRILDHQEPLPAVVVDGRRDVVMHNAAAELLLDGIGEELRRPTLNLYRLLLHPRGLAPRIVDFARYSAQLLARLQADALRTGSAELEALLDELGTYPGVDLQAAPGQDHGRAIFELTLRTPAGELAFLTTLATFGGALDVTVSELVIEALFPANEATARHFTRPRSGARRTRSLRPARG